jgi:hypothetical protein
MESWKEPWTRFKLEVCKALEAPAIIILTQHKIIAARKRGFLYSRSYHGEDMRDSRAPQPAAQDLSDSMNGGGPCERR